MTKRQRVIREQRESAPFTYQIKGRKITGKRRASAVVTLSVPTAEEECPLTLDPIATSTLPCLPGALFMEERPLHTKLTLPCGHAFYALSLVYSWCKNGMLCPCCRAGADDRADPDCLPAHLRSAIASRVQSTLAQEEQDDHAFQIYGVSIPYTTLADAGCLSLILSLHEQPASPLFMFRSRLSAADRPHGTFQPGDLRCVQQALDTGAVFLRLQVEMHVRGVGSITIDSTDLIELRPGVIVVQGLAGVSFQSHTVPVHLYHGNGSSSFSIAVTLSEGRPRLSEVYWLTDEANLELLSGDEGIQSMV